MLRVLSLPLPLILCVLLQCLAPFGSVHAGDNGAVRLVTANLLPYSIQNGTQAGFMVDLVKEIENRLGSERIIDFMPWPRAQRLTMSQPNHIIFPLTRTPEREPHYDWTIKVASIELVFITLAGQPLSMEEARLLPRITVQQDTPFEQYLKERGFENLESVTEPARAPLHLLRTHRVQAWFTAKDLAYYARLVHDIDADLIYSEPVETYEVYIATSRQFPGSLGKAYAETFQTIVTDGTYARIMARYQR